MKILSAYYHGKAVLKKWVLLILFWKKLIIGAHTTWRKGLSVTIGKDGKVEIGKNCFFNNYCSINSLQTIKIGDGTLFGEGVKIYDHNHRFRDPNVPIKYQGYKSAPVNIGKHCWIGSNVIILKGTSIGDNCVIGAGCVVSGEVPSNTILKLTNDNQEEIRLNLNQ
ncbi:acyltransferase [Lactobacillus sp. PV037]|uniref:acyltransferase n=1 Tax=Lactobacillus sp. PV037 TaxID=2594496 RepID=UPI00223EAA3F|nr:acyltransferase [Lactobacillus sp. PV037]QNQ83110.1 acyltransferase [Lactobacillus sp. PV037]